VSTISRFHILLDQGLPRDAAEQLRSGGVECTHVGEIGMASSSDTDILEYARSVGRIVVTLDADFHAILVVSGMSAPSVIRIRLEGLKGPGIATIIREVLAAYASDLAVGCMITVKEQKTTCHLLRTPD
jgi:predicted nuclease of predicted toxin-antitoxin system